MELDTGSALTILPAGMFHEHFDLPLQPTMLKPYAGDRLRPKGVFRAHVCYNGQEFEADAYVVDSDGPALFGRDWLQNIVFDWHSLNNIKANATSAPLSDGTRRRLDALRSRYAAVFGSDRGHLQPSHGHLTLRDGAQPKFLKARPLPYALRDRVGLELDRLEQDGILTKVSHSDWATPVVPIPKKDGSVRICGDFKVTVNPQLKVDQYPLPRIDDILASLGGGKHFSKIDLRSAYLQIEMDDESKTLLTLNTHKGLYRLNRLAFGIASAPAMWQRVMDQLLSGIPKLSASSMTSSSLAKQMTSTYATWRWCCNAFSLPDSGRRIFSDFFSHFVWGKIMVATRKDCANSWASRAQVNDDRASIVDRGQNKAAASWSKQLFQAEPAAGGGGGGGGGHAGGCFVIC